MALNSLFCADVPLSNYSLYDDVQAYGIRLGRISGDVGPVVCAAAVMQ